MSVYKLEFPAIYVAEKFGLFILRGIDNGKYRWSTNLMQFTYFRGRRVS